MVGYDVSDQEQETLAQEIQRETARDPTTYILDILTAVLASEPSPALLTKLFDVWDNVLDVLIRGGEWTQLETVLTMLQEAETVRPDLADSHKQQVAGLFDGLHRPERLKAIGVHLNRTPQANTQGLITLLLMMKQEAVPGLCSVLATLDGPSHQAVIMEALQTNARDHAEPILRGLTDKRPTYVRNLLTILSRWNDPRFGDHVEKTLRHPEATVRREALRLLATLRPSGSGSKLVALLSDGDETVRLTAMKVLTSGQYTVPFSAWAPFVAADEFYDRSPAEKRAIYLAIKHTAGDEAVPYWQGLLTEWSWTNRKRKKNWPYSRRIHSGNSQPRPHWPRSNSGRRKAAPPSNRPAVSHSQQPTGSIDDKSHPQRTPDCEDATRERRSIFQPPGLSSRQRASDPDP